MEVVKQIVVVVRSQIEVVVESQIGVVGLCKKIV